MNRSKAKVPTEEAFSRFIGLTSSPVGISCELLPRNWKGELEVPMEPESVTSILKARDQALEERDRNLDESEVGKWLFASPLAQRAWASARGRRYARPKGNRDSAEVVAERMLSDASSERTSAYYANMGWSPEKVEGYVREANTIEGQRGRLAIKLEVLLRSNPYALACNVASAFNCYFFTDSYLTYCRSSDPRVEAALQLLQAFRTLDDGDLWSVANLRHPEYQLRLPAVRQALGEIVGADRKFPIERIDATSRERALAFDIWCALRKTYRGKNKSAAVFGFLLLDGVMNQPATERAVQRWIKAWIEEGVKLKPSFTLV